MRNVIELTLEIARSMRRYGATADEVERLGARVAASRGVPGRVHVLPTAILATVGEGPQTWVGDGTPGEDRLDRREATEAIALDVIHGMMTVEAATAALAALETSPPRYGRVISTLAAGGTSAATAMLLGGGVLEGLIAGLVGLVLELVDSLARWGALREVVAAFVAMLALHAVDVPFAMGPTLLGALVAWMPGKRMTHAMLDLANGHRMTGTSGLVSALMTLLQLGVGAAAGAQLGSGWFGVARSITAVSLPSWLVLPQVMVFALLMLVCLQARLRDAGWVTLACVAAAVGEQWGIEVFGPRVGGAAGAFAVAMTASAFVAMTGRTAAIPTVPGMLLLVPGTVGFRAIQALTGADIVTGVNDAFAMAIAAMSLVVGHEAGVGLSRAITESVPQPWRIKMNLAPVSQPHL